LLFKLTQFAPVSSNFLCTFHLVDELLESDLGSDSSVEVCVVLCKLYRLFLHSLDLGFVEVALLLNLNFDLMIDARHVIDSGNLE